MSILTLILKIGSFREVQWLANQRQTWDSLQATEFLVRSELL